MFAVYHLNQGYSMCIVINCLESVVGNWEVDKEEASSLTGMLRMPMAVLVRIHIDSLPA